MKNKYATFLKELAHGHDESLDKGLGVCSLFNERFDVSLHDTLPDWVYHNWPCFSGDKSFPVPSVDSNVNEHDIYSVMILSDGMWSGEYGVLRRAWCLHLADYFESL